jgi:hypothetical protein
MSRRSICSARDSAGVHTNHTRAHDHVDASWMTHTCAQADGAACARVKYRSTVRVLTGYSRGTPMRTCEVPEHCKSTHGVLTGYSHAHM